MASSSLFNKTALEIIERLGPRKVLDTKITFNDCMIKTKDKELIVFSPNVVQTRYLDDLLPNWRNNDYTMSKKRDILLKARQEGLTTLISILFFLDTVNTPRTTTVILAHNQRDTEKIFQIIQRLYNNLPSSKKPVSKYASKYEFYWPEIDSTYYVGTAGEKDFGRGSTVNNVHGSEVAMWPDGKGIVSSLLQAVPASGNVFLESTAKGVGNYFNMEWLAAEQDESAFRAVFFPWFEHVEYVTTPKPDFTRTTDEIKFGEKYSLTDHQIQWYRDKVKELREDVVQEYPSNPEEAFLFSGNSYFNNEILRDKYECIPGLFSLSKEPPAPLAAALRKGIGTLQIYKSPQPGRMYVIGADTMEGLIDEDNKPDYDSADVVDIETYEQVAHLHGRWDTHDYGLLLAELGFWYNTAWLGVERNNHGHAVVNAVIHNTSYPSVTPGNPMKGLYFHREFDERKRMRVRKPGWPTNTKTKFFALDQLATVVDDGSARLNSKSSIKEMMYFVKLPGGKAGGIPGNKDDRVISLSICFALIALKPRPVIKRSSRILTEGGMI